MLFGVSGCSKDQTAGAFTPPPMPVETATVEAKTVVDRFDAVGTIEAINSVTIVSEIDGLVKAVPFDEGSSIKKGELIVQLDDSQLKADLARAEAIRDQQKVTYDRVKELSDRGAVSPQEHDNALANLKVAEADVDLAKARLDKTRIVAPFDGVIGARKISPGTFLRAGGSFGTSSAIADLVQLSQLKVTFSAPERFFSMLKRKAEVTVTTSAYRDQAVKGTIEVIEPMVDPSTRSAMITAHIENPEYRFRPGMSANISAVLSTRDNALLVPDEAIFAEGDQMLVFVVKPDSTVGRAVIKIGSRQPGTVEILSGLEVGQMVVSAGHQKLYEGAKVMPIPHQAAGAAQVQGGVQ
ncbi:MAG: efflux RND transporter periplasmic adaptor subunit [bacterium]|nr:efflux RND transporter periplasmic adaptor subunit [bacterium]